MTEEQIKSWKVERDIARQSNDPKLIQKAYDHRDDMMMECIAHQSNRVKKLVDHDITKIDAEIAILKEKLAPCIETDKEYREAKLKFKGARWALGSIAMVSTVVGPVVAIKICKIAGILW